MELISNLFASANQFIGQGVGGDGREPAPSQGGRAGPICAVAACALVVAGTVWYRRSNFSLEDRQVNASPPELTSPVETPVEAGAVGAPEEVKADPAVLRTISGEDFKQIKGMITRAMRTKLTDMGSIKEDLKPGKDALKRSSLFEVMAAIADDPAMMELFKTASSSFSYMAHWGGLVGGLKEEYKDDIEAKEQLPALIDHIAGGNTVNQKKLEAAWDKSLDAFFRAIIAVKVAK